MATRQSVETLIEEIENNGNNTAKEVRDVLSELLDYTENQDNKSELESFGFHTKSPVKNNGNFLSYSFRGFKEGFANLTFDLNIIAPNVKNVYSFVYDGNHKEELAKILSKIVKANQELEFVIPTHLTVAGPRNGTANISTKQNLPLSVGIAFDIQKGSIKFDFFGFGTKEELPFSSATVKTSICFHAPDFNNQ